ncbi:uncharacterized protein LOC144805587 [Lissotriton helveticus]
MICHQGPESGPPRGKATATETPVAEGEQEQSLAGSSAGPNVTTSDAAQMTIRAGASSAEGSTLDAAVPTGGAGGEGSAAADGDIWKLPCTSAGSVKETIEGDPRVATHFFLH